jgi:hypothetical protein
LYKPNLLSAVHCSIFFKQTSAFDSKPKPESTNKVPARHFCREPQHPQKEEEEEEEEEKGEEEDEVEQEEEHFQRDCKVRPSNNCVQKPLSGKAFTTEHNFYVIRNPELCVNSNRRRRHENVGLMEEVLKNLQAIGLEPFDYYGSNFISIYQFTSV